MLSICSVVLVAWSDLHAQDGSNEYFENAALDYDYGLQLDIPQGFGDGEFTFEMWIRLDDSYPVGPTDSGSGQRLNWTDADPAPYSQDSWWFRGNFLIDGHTSSPWNEGTFSIQVVGGGRIRWLFGDDIENVGGPWAIQEWPSSGTSSLLDGAWHQITLVRRWVNVSDADLEMWIDGQLIATEQSPSRQNMRVWWDTWPSDRYRPGREGWFYAAEKQVAIGAKAQYEDFKGLIDEMRFWSRAKTAAEIAATYADPVAGNEPGLVGYFSFGEGSGTEACSSTDPLDCIFLTNPQPGIWSSANAPVGTTGDTQPPTAPPGLLGNAPSASSIDLTWGASTDNVGVVDYQVRRDGALVSTTSSTQFIDTGLTAATTYTYTVTARDAAGNVSPSSQVAVTTQSGADTVPPSMPGNLQGAAVSSSAIDLDWDASTDNVGVADYLIRRDGTQIATTTITDYADTGLAADTSYSYTIVARDAAGNESSPANVIVATQPAVDTQPPTAPPNLQGIGISPSEIDLDWTASSDNVSVADYVVERDGIQVGITSATNFSDSGLTANTSYTYSVSARDPSLNVSAPSMVNVLTLTAPDTTPPSVPTGLTSTGTTSTSVGLSWVASSDDVAVEGYLILRDGAEVGATTGTSFTDIGLVANTTYSFAIVAVDLAGNQSAPSASVAITTQDTGSPPPPADPSGSGSVGPASLFALLLLSAFGRICRRPRGL